MRSGTRRAHCMRRLDQIVDHIAPFQSVDYRYDDVKMKLQSCDDIFVSVRVYSWWLQDF
jgi:hypothetical protein